MLSHCIVWVVMLIKQKIGFVLALMVVACGSTLFVATTQVAAAPQASGANGAVMTDPVSGSDCGGVHTAIIKCDADNSGSLNKNGIWALLLIVINVMTAGVGVLAVGGIVYGAILYTTAEDKADQVNKAVDIIRNVIIGLITFALMWAGLNFLIPGGVFS